MRNCDCRGTTLCPSCLALLARAEGQQTAGPVSRIATRPEAIAHHETRQHLQRTPAWSEVFFLSKVREVATAQGWLSYHTHNSRHSAPGFPDLVLIREAIIFAELKTGQGKLSSEQTQWIELIRLTGQAEAYVWRPSDWDAIVLRLTRHQKGKT